MIAEKLEVCLPVDPLPPIPVPPSRRWRELKVRLLPLLMFMGAVVTVAVLWNRVTLAPTWPNPALAQGAIPPLDPAAALFYSGHAQDPAHHYARQLQRGLAYQPPVGESISN
jgi:hypothetical protein